MSYEQVDEFIWQTRLYLMKRYGCDVSEKDVYPLAWYIRTGRASAGFLKELLKAKPFMIARKLHEGGSVDEVVNRIKSYLWVA